MKLLYLITKSEMGGAQTHVYELCKFFHTEHTITVVAYPGGWLEEKCKELGVTFIPNEYFSNNLNPLRVWKSYTRMQKIVADIAPDIVHCHSSVAGFLGRIAIRNRIPTIYTAHGWGFNIGVGTIQKWISIISEKIVARYTTKIICVSQFVKDLALRYHIASEGKLAVIYNGVEIQSVSDREFEKTIDLVFVGRLAAPKRPDIFLQVIHAMDTSIRAEIIGSGPFADDLRHSIQDYGLSSRVTLRGALKHEEIYATLKKSKILILFSDWEGLPLTILEAMSVGIPVIASDVGGISEVVHDGENGLLCHNTDDISSIAGRIQALLQDDVQYKRLGTQAKKTIEEQFIVAKMIQKIAHVYTQIKSQ